jgi:RNA recognition motif-containing protein
MMNKSLFVGNIAYGAMEKEIKELFDQFGTVEDVHFVMDFRRGRFRGFGFVTMDESGADLALNKMNGYEFQGRALKVTNAQSRKPDSHCFA